MSTASAFQAICKDALQVQGVFVSLYRREPYYGGPEEGGWWGEDIVLEESQRFSFEEDAQTAKERIEKLIEIMNTTAKKDWGEACRRECDWLDERGLDADFLPETNGPTRWFVRVENVRGDSESQGCRHYE